MMYPSNILVSFIFLCISVECTKEMIFEMEMNWLTTTDYNVTSNERRINHSSLLCYLKCKEDKNELLDDGIIVLDMVNIFFDEKLFILDGAIRNIILECMGSHLSKESCGENYSRCKPLITKWSNNSDENSTCCIHESNIVMSNLALDNFSGFPEKSDCLMKCIEGRKSIFSEKGEVEALNVYTNTEFVDIIPERKPIFRHCVLEGSGVHTCEQIIHLYICFFQNMSKAHPREWLYK